MNKKIKKIKINKPVCLTFEIRCSEICYLIACKFVDAHYLVYQIQNLHAINYGILSLKKKVKFNNGHKRLSIDPEMICFGAFRSLVMFFDHLILYKRVKIFCSLPDRFSNFSLLHLLFSL